VVRHSLSAKNKLREKLSSLQVSHMFGYAPQPRGESHPTLEATAQLSFTFFSLTAFLTGSNSRKSSEFFMD
jgi:hypothetical protein